MILNVGPDAKGLFNKKSIETLNAIGDWMARNSDSIYGCTYAGIDKPEWGRYTKKGNKIYAHVLEQPIGPLALTGIDPRKVKSMTRLADGTQVNKGNSWVTKAFEGILFACLGSIPHFTYPLPDAADTVIEIDCDI